MLNFIPVRFTPLMAAPDADGPAGFATNWHGHGSGHQDNNAPGDTAADRHNFGADTAGKSGHNPTQGSNQDDFTAEAGLAGEDGDYGQPAFNKAWHGHGAGHQDNNAPGDTAADRHNFDDATAGKSGHIPTAGSAQDDGEAAAGFPMIELSEADLDAMVPVDEDDDEDMMDMIL